MSAFKTAEKRDRGREGGVSSRADRRSTPGRLGHRVHDELPEAARRAGDEDHGRLARVPRFAPVAERAEEELGDYLRGEDRAERREHDERDVAAQGRDRDAGARERAEERRVLHAERGGERAGHRREGGGARAGMTKNLKNRGRPER